MTTVDYATGTARVSGWPVKDRPGEVIDLPALRDVVYAFNRLMRPPRHHDDVRPSIPAIKAALRVLSNAMAPGTASPTLVPRFDGGLQLEWHMRGVDLEISASHEGELSAWCEHSSGREWEDEGDLNIDRLRKELSLLVSYE